MQVKNSASEIDITECRNIHKRIHKFIPKLNYAKAIQERLKEKGHEVSLDDIYNTRKLRVYKPIIWRELELLVKELYPDYFKKEYITGLG